MYSSGNNSFSNGLVKRKIGLITATGIVIANMIGAGIFTTTGLMADKLPGPGWILLCWFFGGLIALAGALCYAELATRMPEEGGEYVYLKKLYHPALGFITGWTSLFAGFTIPIAGSALGFAEYTIAGLTTDSTVISSSQLIIYQKTTAVSIIIVFTFIHYIGVKLGSGIQNILTALKIAIILGLSFIGIVFANGHGVDLTFNQNGSMNSMALGTVMILVMFSYSGWNASTYIAGEMKNPGKTLPRSLIGGTIIVIFMYLAVNLFILHALPFTELKGTIAVVENASVRVFGDSFGNIMGLLTGLALLSSLSAFIMIGPRVYFAMARDRLFLPFAGKVHPRFGVPGRSVILQGAIATAAVLVGTFEQLFVYIAFALSIFPCLTVAGVFIARKKNIGVESAVQMWGYPAVPLFFLTVSLLMMIFTFINKPAESATACLTVLAGIPGYFLWIKGFKQPKEKTLK